MVVANVISGELPRGIWALIYKASEYTGGYYFFLFS